MVALGGLLTAGCAVKEPPARDVVLEDALPETTTVRAEWTAPADDTGAVDDGWIGSFGDAQLEALVTEAIDLQNPSRRVLSAQVDRAAAQLGLARSALKPQVGLGANLSGTATGAGIRSSQTWRREAPAASAWASPGKPTSGARSARERPQPRRHCAPRPSISSTRASRSPRASPRPGSSPPS